MEDDFRPDLMIAVILFWCVLFWLWAHFFAPAPPPRTHIYYCFLNDEGYAVPCRYLPATIDVSHQPRSTG